MWEFSAFEMPKRKMKKTAILIAGMHRSGTSLLARILNICGCDLPKTLMEPNPSNKTGHWESEKLKILNDDILASAGSSWDDWDSFNPQWYASPVADGFRERALTILEGEFGDSRLFVLKDPRICRILPFWIEMVRAHDAEPFVVSPIRNPLDVAASLKARDGIDPPVGHLLWLRHVLDAEATTRKIKRAWVRYDAFLSRSHAIAYALGDAIGVSWPRSISSEAQIEIDEFVSRELRHHRSDDRELLENPGLSCWIKSSFAIFNRWTCGGIHEKDGEELDRIRSAFDMAAPAFHHALVARGRAVTERDGRIEDLNRAVTERDGRIEDLNRVVMERDGRIEDLNRVVMERDGRIEDLNRVVTERDGRIEDLDRTIAELYLSRSWRVTAPLRAPRRIFYLFYRRHRTWLSQTSRALYRLTPLPDPFKRRIKGSLFRLLPILFRHTAAYRSWNMTRPATDVVEIPAGFGKITDEQWVEEVKDEIDRTNLAIRLIAFYLPQFHPIPENDRWWGRGFTEWRNVAKAQPNYEGHYQPRLPADLGFYDLRITEVMEYQADLAHRYGIHGFCYYYYWFGGTRLLEMPLERMLEIGKPDFPFCLCWANENWTRRWDGHEHELLMAQQHSDEDDDAVIRDLMRYFRHRNYIRIDEKPLFIIYRASLFVDICRTVDRWRELCRNEGIGEIYLVLVESFEYSIKNDKTKLSGFDAAMEFPPHGISVTTEIPGRILNSNYTGLVHDYRRVVADYLGKKEPGYTWFRCVMPGWDNTARRQDEAKIFHNADPDQYEKWLRGVLEQTLDRHCGDERLVFVNAWNEWAEGAYLEPDRRYGHAYLHATRRALEQSAMEAERALLFVIHDAFPAGAQYNALATIDGLITKLNVRVHIASLGDGALMECFERYGKVHRLWEAVDPILEVTKLACNLRKRGTECAILNSAASGTLIAGIRRAGLRTVSLVHELPGIVRSMGLEPAVAEIAGQSDLVIFPSDEVRREFEKLSPIKNFVRIRPQGLYKINSYRSAIDRMMARRKLRSMFDISHDSNVVIGVGYGDRRKGVDLFMEIARRTIAKMSDTHFIWIGDISVELKPIMQNYMKDSFYDTCLHQIDHVNDTDIFYAGADLLALTSREDPFPSVILEAMDARLPVVGFENAGGFASLLQEGAGVLVPSADIAAFSDTICDILEAPEIAQRFGECGRNLIVERFCWTHYLFDLANMAGIVLHRISVVVPNYNYLAYLRQRITSITAQTYPIYELIILDDASTDGSREWLKDEGARLFPEARIFFNERNSGSPFAQWLKGAQIATGDILWIAEADDLCETDFLCTVVSSFSNPKTIFSYCQSKQMFANGDIADESYLDYTNDLSTTKWQTDHVAEAMQEIQHYFGMKNPIPNVSGVLFHRKRFVEILTRESSMISELRTAGDWLIYILYLAQGGQVAFHAKALNLHRRHDEGVILSNHDESALAEIMAIQRFVATYHDVSETTVEQARRYNQILYDKFELDEDMHGTLEDIERSAPVLNPVDSTYTMAHGPGKG